MAEFIDGVGREIKVSIDNLYNFLKQEMSNSVQTVQEFGKRDEIRNDVLEDIKKELEKIRGYDAELKKSNDDILTAVQLLAAIKAPKEQQRTFTPENIQDVASKAGNQAQKDINPQIQIPVLISNKSLDVNIASMAKGAANTIAIAIPDQSPADQVGDKVVLPTADKSVKSMVDKKTNTPKVVQNSYARNIRSVGAALAGTTAAVAGGVAATDIFSGLIKEELEFSKYLGRAAYTQRGITADQGDQLEIFKQYSRQYDLVGRTGKSLAENYKAQLKLIKRGITEEKKFTDLSLMAASAATGLNIDTEQLVDLYGDLSQTMGLSVRQISIIGRDMQSFSKQTGISGEMLAEAAKSTEKIQENLRKAGTTTPTAISGMIKMMAVAMKEGVPELGQEIGEAYTKGLFATLKDGMTEVQRMLLIIGSSVDKTGALTERIRTGTTNTEDKKNISQEIMRQSTLRLSDSLSGMGIEESDFFAPIEDVMKKLRMGVEVSTDETDKLAKFMDKGMVQRMTAFGVDANTASVVGKQVMTSLGLVGKDIGELGKIFKIAGAGTQEINEGLNKMSLVGENLSDAAFQKEIKNLKITEPLVEGVLNDLNARLEKVAPEKMIDAKRAKTALASPAEYDALLKDIIAAGQIAGTKEAVGTNVIDAVQQKIMEIGQTLRRMFNPLEQILNAINPKMLVLVGLLGSMVAAIASFTLVIFPILRHLRKEGIVSGALPKIFNRQSKASKAMTAGMSASGRAANTLEIPLPGLSNMKPGIGKPGIGIAKAVKKYIVHSMEPLKEAFGILGESKTLQFAKNAGKSVGDAFRTMGKGIGWAATETASILNVAYQPFVKVLRKSGKHIGDTLRMVGKSLSWATTETASVLGDASKFVWNKTKGIRGKTKDIGSKVWEKTRGVGVGIGEIGGRAWDKTKGVRGKVWDKAKGAGRFVAGEGSIIGRAGAKVMESAGRFLAPALTALGVSGETASAAIASIGVALGPIAVAAVAAGAAILGLHGALAAGAKAAEIFKVKEEELTTTQRMGAEGAGLLTGILNGLTFGIFSEQLGAVGTWTIAIAKFLDEFWIFSAALQIILVPLKALWGTIVGLWRFIKNAFIGLWEGILIAVEPIVDLFKDLQAQFSEMFPSLSNGSSAWIDVVEVVAQSLGYLGTALGWVFKAIGWVIKIILSVFVPVIKMVVQGLIAVGKWIYKTFEPLFEFFGTLYDAVKALFEGDFSTFGAKLGEAIIKGFVMVPRMLLNLITGFFGLIGNLFKSIWDGIVNGLQRMGNYFLSVGTGSFWSDFATGFKNVMSGIWTAMTDTWNGFWAGIKNEFDLFVAELKLGVMNIIDLIPGSRKAGFTSEEGIAAQQKIVDDLKNFSIEAEIKKNLPIAGSPGATPIPTAIPPSTTTNMSPSRGGFLNRAGGAPVVPNVPGDNNINFDDIELFPSFQNKEMPIVVPKAAPESKVKTTTRKTGGSYQFVGPLGESQGLKPGSVLPVETSSTSDVRTLPMGSMNVEGNVNREKATSQPSKVEVVNSGMDELSQLNSTQVQHLADIKDGINKIASALTTSPNKVGNATASADKTATYSTGNSKMVDYFESPFAYGNNAMTQQSIVQTGVG